MDTVSLADFKKLEIKVAEIKEVSPHPNADKLFVIKIDIGNGEEKQIVAGIRLNYKIEELLGKQVVVINNIEPSLIRGVESQAMLLAAKDNDQVVVLTCDKKVTTGSRVS
jgi:methionyl-tRNA synthetase